MTHNSSPTALERDAPSGASTVGALTVRNLVKTYGVGPTAVRALRGINLDLAPGTITVLSGKSGSGKTTLLNCISGLDQPDSGVVRFGEHEITSMTSVERVDLRRRIGFVFQHFGLIPMLTAHENVGLPLRMVKTPARVRDQKVEEALALVNLTKQSPQLPGQLSGGEQQRVAIARAIVTQPDLLIADEPTGQLDSATGKQIIDLLIAISREHQTTTIIASHDSKLIERADSHIHLRDGVL